MREEKQIFNIVGEKLVYWVSILEKFNLLCCNILFFAWIYYFPFFK